MEMPTAPYLNTSFLMEIQDAFFVENSSGLQAGQLLGLLGPPDGLAPNAKGALAIGQMVRGIISVGDQVEIIGLQETNLTSIVIGATIMPKFRDVAHMVEWRGGGSVAVFLEGLEREQLQRGQVLATPGTFQASRKFKAQIQFAPTEYAVKQQPYMNLYRSALYMRHTNVYATMWLPEGKRHLVPGDKMELNIELNEPMALEVGLRFAIGKHVGAGIITSLME